MAKCLESILFTSTSFFFKEPGLDFVRSSRMLRRTELKNIASIDDAKEESIQFPKASTAGQIYGSNYAAIIWI